jgi:hypothetical protein
MPDLKRSVGEVGFLLFHVKCPPVPASASKVPHELDGYVNTKLTGGRVYKVYAEVQAPKPKTNGGPRRGSAAQGPWKGTGLNFSEGTIGLVASF